MWLAEPHSNTSEINGTMALHLNLLHEEIAEERQRQRDPVKLGIMAACLLGAILALFYAFKAYQTLNTRTRLSTLEQQWSAIEPKVTEAQNRARELNKIISTTRVLDQVMERRFLWAPVLEKISRSVAPNAQLTNLSASVENGLVTVDVEGLAAGREPRAAAEELRQLLNEQFDAGSTEAKVEFRSLEDLDTLVNVAGANMPVARFTIGISFKAESAKADKPVAAK